MINPIIVKFKKWVDFRGYVYVAKKMGLKSTSKIERWYKEDRVPKGLQPIVDKIISEDRKVEV